MKVRIRIRARARATVRATVVCRVRVSMGGHTVPITANTIFTQ